RLLRSFPTRRSSDLSATLQAGREANADLSRIVDELRSAEAPSRRLVAAVARRALVALRGHDGPARAELAAFFESYARQNDERFRSEEHTSELQSPDH